MSRRRSSLLAPPSRNELQSASITSPLLPFSNSPINELKTLCRNAFPLSITFFLQYSLFMSALLCVGHLGKIELGAVSLATMTGSITGVAFVQGMATCLDTLCSQAFGAQNFSLVGLYFQRGVLMIMLMLVPILVFWWNSSFFLKFVVSNDKESQKLTLLASHYLRFMVFSMPGFTVFECAKRFLQSQNIFHASTLVLVVCAPFNALLMYCLVWRFGFGFYGAPMAIAITNSLMALLLCLYIAYVDGSQCWTPITLKCLSNWSSLFALALPGLVMVLSEFLAYEVMTLAASYLGTNELAAQTIMSSTTSLLYEIPFAVGCAVSARVANFIGAKFLKGAKQSAYVSLYLALGVGIFNAVLLVVFRNEVVSFFTNDLDVKRLAARYIPMCAFMHVMDCIACVLAGVLRGQGRQKIGGYINLVCYHFVGVPLGVFLCFGPPKLELVGIWLGFYAALGSVTLLSMIALRMSDWDGIMNYERSE